MKLAAGAYEAVFLPELGMVGSSLKHRGLELLSFAGEAAVRDRHTTGLPLVAPWANRLSRRRFTVGRVEVDLRRRRVHTDPNGLPIHGTMVGAFPWTVVRADPAHLVARYAYHDPRFPFPHELEIDARLSEAGLSLTTSVRATGRRRVPVSFGWHPYLRLPGPRRRWLLRLPARRHLELDELVLPTGGERREPAEEVTLGSRFFDDLYALGRDRVLAVSSRGRRVEVRLGAAYPFAQVYAPPDKRFVCLEPMTAPIDALVRGQCPLVPPGERFSAAFTVSASEEP